MKAYGGVHVHIHIFLTSALAGGEWSVLRPGSFTSGEKAHGSHWIGGWVDPRAGDLDDVEKRNFFTLLGLELRPLHRRARNQSLSQLLVEDKSCLKPSGHHDQDLQGQFMFRPSTETR
jgi:hypothetical protein